MAHKGAQMRTFFENPLFGEAMHALRMNIYHQWAETKLGSVGTEKREELHRLYAASVELERTLLSFAESGDFLIDQIRAQNRLTEQGSFDA